MKDEILEELNILYKKAYDAGVKNCKDIIKESFWECPMHKELQTDGSCKECNQCLEVNAVLAPLLKALNKQYEDRNIN